MVERCIMIFPEFSNMNIIDEIRNKYDPLAQHVRPHITFVFPFQSEITVPSNFSPPALSSLIKVLQGL